MATTVYFGGVGYSIPSPGDTDDWGAALNAYLTAIAASQPAAKLTATGTAARAPFLITPQSAPTGPNVVGDLYTTASGELYICTVAGTPGTFVKVGAGATYPLVFGASSVAANTTYGISVGGLGGALTSDDQFTVMVGAGTISKFHVKLSTNCNSSLGTITLTVRKNAVDTSMVIVLTCSAISGTQAYSTTTTGAFSVVEGDLLSIKLVTTGLSGPVGRIMALLTFTAA